MLNKDPVTLNDSVVEIDGHELDFTRLRFWSDTFKQADLLRYQDGDVQMMFDNPETTTYELTLTTEQVPDYITQYSKSGERFPIHIENEYFDLTVDNARIERLDDGTFTIVARVLRRGLAHVC